MTVTEDGGIDRARIVKHLRDEPGQRPSDLARAFDVHPSTAEYHLRRLADEDRVARVRVGRELHHYVTGDGLCRRGRQVHARLTDAGRALLREALDRRVVPRQAVVERGFTASAVRWAIDRLTDVGALERLAWGVYELEEDWQGCVLAALREDACARCNETEAAATPTTPRAAAASRAGRA